MTNKIQDLMTKCGLKPEVAASLCESIDTHIKEQNKLSQASYDAKLEEAKKVCVEEVDNYKRELARRLQIFCEAKGGVIEQQVSKQSAIKESAAMARLRDIQTLLLGVKPLVGSDSNSSSKQELAKAKAENKQLKESANRAVESANRATAIANKVMKKNRVLENRILAEEKTQASRPSKPAVRSNRPVAARSSQPVTTRATLSENQERSLAGRDQVNVFTPSGIANLID